MARTTRADHGAPVVPEPDGWTRKHVDEDGHIAYCGADGTLLAGEPRAVGELDRELDAQQKVRAKLTTEQRTAVAEFWQRRNTEYKRLTAARRRRLRRGEASDFSAEWIAAGRHAMRTLPATSAPTTTRPREHRPTTRRRTSSSSSTSSSDPGEPEPPARRFCVRCGRDISHRRADAKTCGSKCRQEKKRRGAGPVERLLDARDDQWDEAAHEGGRRDLTYAIDRQLGELYAAPLPEARRAKIAQRTGLDATDPDLLSAMAQWDYYAPIRRRGSAWAHSEHCLRTRTVAAVA